VSSSLFHSCPSCSSRVSKWEIFLSQLQLTHLPPPPPPQTTNTTTSAVGVAKRRLEISADAPPYSICWLLASSLASNHDYNEHDGYDHSQTYSWIPPTATAATAAVSSNQPRAHYHVSDISWRIFSKITCDHPTSGSPPFPKSGVDDHELFWISPKPPLYTGPPATWWISRQI
jgi:hypothetical protein